MLDELSESANAGCADGIESTKARTRIRLPDIINLLFETEGQSS